MVTINHLEDSGFQCPDAAEKFLDNWVTRALQTDLKSIKKIARMLCSHKLFILHWFKAKGRLSSCTVEDFASTQGKAHYEESLWFQNTKMSEYFSISYTWQITDA